MVGHIAKWAPLVLLIACGGVRLPDTTALPTGSGWFCGTDDFPGCDRTADTCEAATQRIGSLVVSAGAPPKSADCKSQPTATCFTYVRGEVTAYDCFRSRRDCESFLREAARAPTQYRHSSSCGTWD